MNVEMGNSASAARIKARMTLDEGRDSSRPIEKRRHQKERSERALKDDFIRRACGLFGVSAEEIIGEAGASQSTSRLTRISLASLPILARERLGALPEIEAKRMILELISASRRPRANRNHSSKSGRSAPSRAAESLA